MAGYEELAGSPREAFGESSGPSATRVFLIPWATRFTFADALVGDGNGSVYPGFDHCRVKQIEIEPFSKEFPPNGVIMDPATDMVEYLANGGVAAQVTVSYGPSFADKTWPNDIDFPALREGTELRLRIRGSGQFLTLPGRFTRPYASSDTCPPDMNARVVIPITEYQIQWDYVGNVRVKWLEERLGHVNSVKFLGAEPETLLFESFDVDDSFRVDVTDPHCNRVNMLLRKRHVQGHTTYGWNHDFLENTGWTRIEFENGESRYPLTDLGGLFT